jgi:hypothetical protein
VKEEGILVESIGEDEPWYSKELGWKGWFGVAIVVTIIILFL